MSQGKLSLINQVSVLAFTALCVIAALGWLDIRDRANISKILETQERLLAVKQSLSKIERNLLSARNDELEMTQTRNPEAFEKFQGKIESAQALSVELIDTIDDRTNLPQESIDTLKITLSENLNQYRASVQSSAELEMQIGLQDGQGLLHDIEVIRDEMIRLMQSLNQDSLLLAFSNLRLSEQEFSETLNMKISAQLVEDIFQFRSEIKTTELYPEVQASLLSSLEEYDNLVVRLMESTLELELAIAANTLHFSRIIPELEKSQVTLDQRLSLMERTLVHQRQISTIQTIILFVGAFLIILIFIFVQIRNNQQLVLRLRQLANHMGEVALGYYPNPHDLPEGKDEVGVLSQAFLSMASQIHEQIDTIEEERKKAEVANKAKSVFLANMSHELRTPLNAILGFSQIMQQTPLVDLECRRYLNIINNSGEHLLALINDVLEISKIESGKFSLKLTSFDLDHLLAMLQKLFQEKAECKQLTLTVTRSPTAPRYLRADKAKLRQILINLLGNAIKFTHTGTVSLTVLLDETVIKVHAPQGVDDTPSPPGSTSPSGANLEGTLAYRSLANLRFIVEDTGPGIAPEEFEHIFASFTQTDLGQQSQEGSGLGLAISRQFARFMGGDLTVASTLGQGSVFTLMLQAECLDDVSGKIAAPLRHPSGRIQHLAPDQKRQRILVAEDREGNRLLMRKLLETVGFEVRAAHNGSLAVELWQKWHPNLILMDIQMPVMDGLEAITQIRQVSHLPQPKIIALTASAFEEQRQAILNAGCDDFASKPIDREQLLALIGRHLGVCYLYDEPISSPTPPRSPKPLTSDCLSIMPADWIEQMYRAAIRGDDRLVHMLIQQVPQAQQDLIATLTELTNTYRFDVLIELAGPVKS
ncbi:MAG: response regulator [Leptolyngbya sp. SIO1E4]|nr:response regulator [Leptolyngbya sp. SIO1E4]